jgi:hypothetical protein
VNLPLLMVTRDAEARSAFGVAVRSPRMRHATPKAAPQRDRFA